MLRPKAGSLLLTVLVFTGAAVLVAALSL